MILAELSIEQALPGAQRGEIRDGVEGPTVRSAEGESGVLVLKNGTFGGHTVKNIHAQSDSRLTQAAEEITPRLHFVMLQRRNGGFNPAHQSICAFQAAAGCVASRHEFGGADDLFDWGMQWRGEDDVREGIFADGIEVFAVFESG
jgi:hypothetical protein